MSSCVSQLAVDLPDANTSRIVFWRSANLGQAVPAPLYEIGHDGLSFIGSLDNDRYLMVDTAPGASLFSVVTETAGFWSVRLQPGQVYRCEVKPVAGLWQARFSLQPGSTIPKGLSSQIKTAQPSQAELLRVKRVNYRDFNKLKK